MKTIIHIRVRFKRLAHIILSHLRIGSDIFLYLHFFQFHFIVLIITLPDFIPDDGHLFGRNMLEFIVRTNAFWCTCVHLLVLLWYGIKYDIYNTYIYVYI